MYRGTDMTRDETVKLLYLLHTTYPNSFSGLNTEKIGQMADVWQMILEEENFNDMQMAFKMYCKTDTTGFAPAPGQLIAMIHDITEPYVSTAEEAWSKVLMAARDGTYHAEERFNAFDDITKMCVGSPANLSAMSLVDETALTTVIRSQFIKEYRRLEDMFRKEHRYGSDVQREIADNRARMREALSLAKLSTDQLMIEGE